MGCFNMACSISNLSINEGDRVMFLPLVKTHELTTKTNLLYQDDLFRPLCLPIEGEYDDYGSITNIVRNKNTEIIENVYNKDIEEFIDSITDSIKESTEIGGMFILKDVYDEFIKFAMERNSMLNSYVTEHILFKLGFEKAQIEFSDKYYKSIYIKDSYPYFLKFGNYGCELVHQKYKEGSEVEDGIDLKDSKETYRNHNDVYDVERLLKYWKLETGKELDITEIVDLNSFHSSYLENKEGTLEVIELFKDKPDFVNKYICMKLFTNDKFSDNIKNAYIPYVLDDSLKEDLINFRAFDNSMYSCNRFFFPAMNGEQSGNDIASKMLLDISYKIINERLKDCEDEF